jgi:small-conductance mechanosensitive channel
MTLVELFRKFEGIVTYTIVTVGDTPITLTSLVVFLAIFASVIALSKVFTRMLARRILVKLHVRESTAYTIQRLTHYIIVIIGAIIVPNSEFISQRVTNWSHGDPKLRLDVDVGVSYGSDLDTVIRCLEEVAAENASILKDPPPEVMHLGFGDSAWNMQLRCWIKEPKGHWRVLSELNCAIVRKFREKGVEIPFPQRDLHVRSSIPFPLKGTGAGS